MAGCVPSRKGEHSIIADIPCSVDVLLNCPIDVFASKRKLTCPKATTTHKSAQQSSLIFSSGPSPVVKKKLVPRTRPKCILVSNLPSITRNS